MKTVNQHGKRFLHLLSEMVDAIWYGQQSVLT